MAPRRRESRASPPVEGSSRNADRPVSGGAGEDDNPTREDGDGDTGTTSRPPPLRRRTLPSDDDESDNAPVDDSGVFSTRFTTIVDKMKSNLSDGFEPTLDGQPQTFDELLQQYNAYMKFADSVLRICDLTGRPSQGRLTATEAEMITLAIMLKLNLKGREGWSGTKDQHGNPDKRLVMEASRTENEMVQSLWKVELVTPEACIAKIYSIYNLYVVPENRRDNFGINRIINDHRKVPFHHRMHDVLIPLCQIGTWNSVRQVGSNRIRKFMEENPNDWWEIPPLQFAYDWAQKVDRSIHLDPVERRIPYFGIDMEEIRLIREGSAPESSQHPVALSLKTMRSGDYRRQSGDYERQSGDYQRQSGDYQRHSGNWRLSKRRNREVQYDDRQGNGKRFRRSQNQQDRASKGPSQVARNIVDRDIQCRKCRGFGHKYAQCPSVMKENDESKK